jgi:hypothetical protein
VPTTKLAGKREVLLKVGTVGDEKNGVQGTLVEKLVEMLVDGKPRYVTGKGINVIVVDPCAVELIEYQYLQ